MHGKSAVPLRAKTDPGGSASLESLGLPKDVRQQMEGLSEDERNSILSMVGLTGASKGKRKQRQPKPKETSAQRRQRRQASEAKRKAEAELEARGESAAAAGAATQRGSAKRPAKDAAVGATRGGRVSQVEREDALFFSDALPSERAQEPPRPASPAGAGGRSARGHAAYRALVWLICVRRGCCAQGNFLQSIFGETAGQGGDADWAEDSDDDDDEDEEEEGGAWDVDQEPSAGGDSAALGRAEEARFFSDAPPAGRAGRDRALLDSIFGETLGQEPAAWAAEEGEEEVEVGGEGGGGEREEEEGDEDDFSFLGQQRGARARAELRRAAEADTAAGVTPPVAAGAVRGKMEFPDISTIDPYDPQVRTNDAAPAGGPLQRAFFRPPPSLDPALPRRGADPRPARAQTFGYTLVGAVLGAHGVPPHLRAPSPVACQPRSIPLPCHFCLLHRRHHLLQARGAPVGGAARTPGARGARGAA